MSVFLILGQVAAQRPENGRMSIVEAVRWRESGPVLGDKVAFETKRAGDRTGSAKDLGRTAQRVKKERVTKERPPTR